MLRGVARMTPMDYECAAMNHLAWELSVWLHILAATLWIGGMVCFALVMLPVVRRSGSLQQKGDAPEFIYKTGARFRLLSWACLAVLLVTGALNLYYRGITAEMLLDPGFWRAGFGAALRWKLLVVAGVLAVSGVHDFVIGPLATERWRAAPESAAARRLRKTAGWMGRVNLLLALAAVFFAVALVRGWPP